MSRENQNYGFALRPFLDADEEFLVGLYRSTRESELAMAPWSDQQREAFVRSQHASQLGHYQSKYPAAEHLIIEVEGNPVGRIYVDRRSDEIRILDISLLPEHRGRGIGSPIIGELMREASRDGKSLTIYLESIGDGARSRSLFERLGFRPVETNGFHILYSWRNRTGSPDARI